MPTMWSCPTALRVVSTSRFRFDVPEFPKKRMRKLPKWDKVEEKNLHEFWKGVGLSASNASRLARKGHNLSRFRDLDGIREKLEDLREIFPENNVPRMVSRSPALLLMTEESLRKKIEDMEELFPGVDVYSILNKQPTILNLDIESFLPSQLLLLEELLPGVDTIKLVESRPPLLYLNIKENVAENLNALHDILPQGTDVNAMVTSQPSLLWMDVRGTVRGKMERLKGILSEDQFSDLCMKPVSFARAILSSDRAIDRLYFLKNTHALDDPEKFSPMTFLVMSRVRFCNEHPSFESWCRKKGNGT